jgi:phenylalanyl-tRNA synthetase beta chain
MFGRLSPSLRLRRRVEDMLVGLGYSEIYTPSLVEQDSDPEALRLPEPITIELAVLRTSLLPSLTEAARRNHEVGNEGVALFEIARVYLPSGGPLPDERRHVAGITEGGFSRAKGTVEALARALKANLHFSRAEHELFHPSRSASVTAGVVGELHPSLLEGQWSAFELNLAELEAAVPERVQYEDVISFPAVRQDLAFVVDVDVPAGDLFAVAREAAGPDLRELRFLSDYREPPIPPGKKSIAFSVAFQSPERTLTDEDAASIRARIVEALKRRFGAELRA